MIKETRKIKDFVQNCPSVHFLHYELCSSLDESKTSHVMLAESQNEETPEECELGKPGSFFCINENYAANWYHASPYVPYSFVLTEGEDVLQKDGSFAETSPEHPLYVYHMTQYESYAGGETPFYHVQWVCYEDNAPWWSVRYFAKIISVSKKKIKSLSIDEIEKCGFSATNNFSSSYKSSLRNFIDSWNMCNKIQYKDDPYVWIIDFEKPREIRSQIIAEKESPNFDNRSNTSIL